MVHWLPHLLSVTLFKCDCHWRHFQPYMYIGGLMLLVSLAGTEARLCHSEKKPSRKESRNFIMYNVQHLQSFI